MRRMLEVFEDVFAQAQQHGAHRLQRAGAVADLVFHRGAHLGERFAVLGDEEHRIIAKALFAAALALGSFCASLISLQAASGPRKCAA